MTIPRMKVSVSERDVPPLFIVGCGRSGTTLLRMIFNNHPDLAIPDESHFIYRSAISRVAGKLPANLKDQKSWNRFLDYLGKCTPMHQWGLSFPSLIDRLERIQDRSYASVFTAIFKEFMHSEGKSRWGDKTPLHVNYILLVNHFFPNAKFIHIIRDGRDVALSLLSRKWGPRRIEYSGHYWKWLVLMGMLCGRILGSERYREIRYEDLINEPERILKSLCGWIDLEYDPVMLEYYGSKEAKKYVNLSKADPNEAVWNKLGNPINRDSTQKWKKHMSSYEHNSILRQAGCLLLHFGYEIDRLPPQQRREYKVICDMLQPESIKLLNREAVVRRHGELWTRLDLQLDRFSQFRCFITHNYYHWARYGIRWQRTVGQMMC